MCGYVFYILYNSKIKRNFQDVFIAQEITYPGEMTAFVII